MADAFIVGRTLGVTALAAVGATGSMNFLVVGFVINFTLGAAIVTSQRFGAGDQGGLRRSFAASIFLGAVFTLILLGISLFSARPLLTLLRTPAEIYEQSYSYIVIIYAALPVCLLFNLCSNVMRSLGDSRSPLYILIIACVINIALDYLFILVFHTGVEGAAWATVIAQLISGLLCIPVIIIKLPLLHLKKEDWKLDWPELWTHLRLALPTGFMMSIIAVGGVTVTFALNRLGTVAVAAYTASQKIDMLANMPLSSFGASLGTYTAQNYGARRYDRIKRGVGHCAAMSCSWAVLMGTLYFFVGHRLSALFLGNEEAAITLSHTYLKIVGCSYIFLAWLFICRQTLQGLGNSLVPTLSGLAELFMRCFAAIVLSHFFGFPGICFASPLAWSGACIPLTIALIYTITKILNRKILAEKKSLSRG
jgi:putative MATE family efflux protein